MFQLPQEYGKLSDERFATVSANYEAEQKALKESLVQLKADIEMQNDKTANVSEFVEKVRRYTEIRELTPTIVNEFMDYIMVSKKQMIDGKTVYPIDIYYSGIGIIDAPSAEEYEDMFQERLKQKHSDKLRHIDSNVPRKKSHSLFSTPRTIPWNHNRAHNRRPAFSTPWIFQTASAC